MSDCQLYQWLLFGIQQNMNSTYGAELNSSIVRCISAVGILLQLRKHINTEKMTGLFQRIGVSKSRNQARLNDDRSSATKTNIYLRNTFH